jgi:hypothetical protein
VSPLFSSATEDEANKLQDSILQGRHTQSQESNRNDSYKLPVDKNKSDNSMGEEDNERDEDDGNGGSNLSKDSDGPPREMEQPTLALHEYIPLEGGLGHLSHMEQYT